MHFFFGVCIFFVVSVFVFSLDLQFPSRNKDKIKLRSAMERALTHRQST